MGAMGAAVGEAVDRSERLIDGLLVRVGAVPSDPAFATTSVLDVRSVLQQG